jgi:hypothetical protein
MGETFKCFSIYEQGARWGFFHGHEAWSRVRTRLTL